MAAKAGQFTDKQGQYLAFIYAYTQVMGQPPAEDDFRRCFPVTAAAVHQMLVTLERQGLISRQRGVSRSIDLHVPPEKLPILRREATFRIPSGPIWIKTRPHQSHQDALLEIVRTESRRRPTPSARTARVSAARRKTTRAVRR